MKGKVAIVTGAGSGIGAGCAQALADAGASVCLNWFGAYGDAAAAHAASLPDAFAHEADVGDPAAVDGLVAATLERYGRLDVLVNSAGIVRFAPILETTLEDWDAIMRVNLRGAFICLQAAARAMADGGSIVNISSVHEGLALRGATAYVAAKGGVGMLMRNAALELAPRGIRVNNVAPGAIATPINGATLTNPEQLAKNELAIPQGRMGRPEDVAEVVAFLAGDRARYVTGATYVVDGGLTHHVGVV